ncbi:hypothetical protein CF327_g7663 [Tilletia walkeri]|nr:hypothetical protein CF327_g7663 [Tilletia walkeri]
MPDDAQEDLAVFTLDELRAHGRTSLKASTDTELNERFSANKVLTTVITLLQSIFGSSFDSLEKTEYGLPTMGVFPSDWPWSDVVTLCLIWLRNSDVCDSPRPWCFPPPVKEEPPVSPTKDSADSLGRLRTSLAFDHHNVVHFLGWLALQYVRGQNQFVDHLTGLPVFFGPAHGYRSNSSLCATKIAHRVHGMPFCFGWQSELPVNVNEFDSTSCNAILALRATSWWRGGRRGAALHDSLRRHLPHLFRFSNSEVPAHISQLFDSSLQLTKNEQDAVAKFYRARAPTFADTVDSFVFINVVSPVEQIILFRLLYGDGRYADYFDEQRHAEKLQNLQQLKIGFEIAEASSSTPIEIPALTNTELLSLQQKTQQRRALKWSQSGKAIPLFMQKK